MRLHWLAIVALCLSPSYIWASDNLSAPPVSLNQNGQTGFIHLPSARRLEAGTAYAGFALGQPYDNIYVGMQPLPALRLVIRQDVETKTGVPYYGFDTQVQLWREKEWRPQAAVGYTHMFGQNRLAGEYLIFNKRVWDVDVMGGVGWGRYANAGLTLRNPLDAVSDHFDSPGRDDGSGKYGPNAWFKGHDIGLFAGVNYQTGWQPLSLQLEYDPDNYVDERRLYDVKRTAPLNIGARYIVPDDSPILPGFAVQAALESLARFTINVNYSFNYAAEDSATLQTLKDKTDADKVQLSLLHDRNLPLEETVTLARRDQLDIYATSQNDADTSLWVRMPVDAYAPAAAIGRTAYIAAAHSDDDNNSITVVPEASGLMVGGYRFLQSDLDQADNYNGSREEILQDMQVLPAQEIVEPTAPRPILQPWLLKAELLNQFSFFDFGETITARERALFGGRYEPARGIIFDGALALQTDQNTDAIIPSDRPVRSLINQYGKNLVGLERAYGAWLFNPMPEVSARLSGGYFEDMYGGVAGEILYQPLTARWALGLDVIYLMQRNPHDEFVFLDYRTVTGALSFYYEMPRYDLTTIIRLEQFLARDHGVELAMEHRFNNGTQLGFNSTYSNDKDVSGPADFDRLDVSMYLRVPFYSDPDTYHAPIEAVVTNQLKSFGRDKGQATVIPDRLYNVSRPVSYGAIENSWDHLLDDVAD